MEEKIEQAYLYDFYGELLNEHQRKIYEDFVFNDLSLGEIADEEGISRQGVHDMVKRCTKTLEGYEEKLRLIEKFKTAKQLVAEIHRLTGEFHTSHDEAIMEEIGRISNQILEEL
ncbi:MAG: YlxM family DNA-binding protein [Roseburia sp.]